MTDNRLDEVAVLLKNAKNVAISCHVRPDGDALGSVYALKLALENAGKRAVFFAEEQPPERLRIIPAMPDALTEFPKDGEKFDLYVALDCADIARLGNFYVPYSSFKGRTLNIDHHVSNTRYAQCNFVSPDSTATCEILPRILLAAGFKITKQIADLLTLGLLTDSGNFSHNDVSSETFKVAAMLKDCGADFCEIGYQMFTRQSKARALLYIRVLNTLRFELEGKVAFITVRQKDFDETGTDKSHTEGFVDFALSIDGVNVSVSLLEFKPNQYKVSLRSREINVNAVAATFGGGGHILASGCVVCGEYEEVIERLTQAIYRQL